MIIIRHSTNDLRIVHSVPLCYIYLAMLHYKSCVRTWKQKAADIALGVFGIIAAFYTTIQTVAVSTIPSLSRPCLTLASTAHDTAPNCTSFISGKLPYSRLLAKAPANVPPHRELLSKLEPP
jgi:hypothetical protein